jgi:hypothetical protein
MPSINYAVSASALGVTINQTVSRTADGIDVRAVPLPAGIAGTLSTRTDNATGVLTVPTGHGITTANMVDVYWSGGRRYGATVTGTTSTTISFNVGSGTNLPIATTAIVVSPQVTVQLAFKAGSLVFFAASQTYTTLGETAASHVDYQDASSVELLSQDLTANTPAVCDVAGGSTNLFSGNPVVKALASNGSAVNAATLNLIVVQNSTL